MLDELVDRDAIGPLERYCGHTRKKPQRKRK